MVRPELNILVSVASYKPAVVYGGPVYSIAALCEELQRQNINITVLTTNANGKDDFDYPNGEVKMVGGIKVIYYRRITGDHTSVSPAHTWALLKSIRNYDVIHIQGWWNWVAMLSLLVCKVYRVPHVLSPRGALSEYTFKTGRTRYVKKWLHQSIFKSILNRTWLHVTSEMEAEKFSRVLTNSRVIQIPNIVNFPSPRPVRIHRGGVLQIIFLGRIDPVKNLELLLSSLQRVSFPFHLSIVGDGDPAYIQFLRTLIPTTGQVTFSKPVYDDLKFDELAKADLLVLLSHTENFGNVILEALSQGTAVLVSRNVGAADMVSKYNLGWVIAPELNRCVETLNAINESRNRLDEIRDTGPVILSKYFGSKALSFRYIHDCYGSVNPKFLKSPLMPEIV